MHTIRHSEFSKGKYKFFTNHLKRPEVSGLGARRNRKTVLLLEFDSQIGI
jgi:hypothetical protein